MESQTPGLRQNEQIGILQEPAVDFQPMTGVLDTRNGYQSLDPSLHDFGWDCAFPRADASEISRLKHKDPGAGLIQKPGKLKIIDLPFLLGVIREPNGTEVHINVIAPRAVKLGKYRQEAIEESFLAALLALGFTQQYADPSPGSQVFHHDHSI